MRFTNFQFGPVRSGFPAGKFAIVFGKLVLHPALVFVVLSLLMGAATPFVLAAKLIAAVPMLSNYPGLGATYGVEPACATAPPAWGTLSVGRLFRLLAQVRSFQFPEVSLLHRVRVTVQTKIISVEIASQYSGTFRSQRHRRLSGHGRAQRFFRSAAAPVPSRP